MRQKFTFEDWLTTPFNAIFFDNKTKKGSVDTAEYTWVTLIETFAKNVETMPYSNEINKYDSLVLKKFIEKETGIAIVLDPIEEEIHTEILPTNQTTEILSWVESIENHANGDEIVPHIQVSEEILPSTAIEPMQEDPIEKLLDHLKPIPEQPSLFSSLSLSQVSLPQNLEKISTRPPVPSYLNNSLAEELNRVLTSQLLHPPSISLAVPAAITPVQPKKSALKRTFSSLAETGSDPAVQQTQQAQKRLSFAIEENRPARTKPVIKKARVIPLEMPNTSTSSRIARIKSATQPIELIRPIQRPVDSQISYKAFPYSTPLDYPIIAQFQGTPEETAAPFFSHDRDWIIHKIHQARSNNIGTVISGLTLLDKMYIYADFFRTSVSKGPGNHLLLMTEISDWFYKELDAALTANSNQKGKQPQLDITPTIILCKTKRDLLSALKAEKQNVLILTSHGVAKVVDHSFFHEFTLKSIIIDDVQTNENDNISPVREFIRNQCKKTEEPNQEQPAILWSTKTLYENHISELYTQLSLINPDKFSTATAKALNEILSDTLSKLTKIDQYSESKQFQAQVYNAFGHFYHFKQVLAHAAFAIRKDETTVSSPFNTFFQENINEERTAWEKFLGDSSADLSHDFALWCDVLVRSAYRICYKDKNPIIADALAATLNEYVDMLKKDTSTDMLEEQIQQLTPRISTKQTSPTVAVDHSTIVNTTILDADAEISERELIVIPLPKETSREFTEKLGVLLLNAANDPSSKYLISQICRILDTEDGQKLRRAVREGTLEHKARIPHEVKAKELNSLLNKFYDKAQKNQKNEIPYSVCVYKFQNSSHKGELGKFRLIESQKNPQARHTIRLYVSQNATPGDCHYDLLVRKNSSRKDT